MTVSGIWNRWVQDGHTKRHAVSQRPPIASSREDRNITRMALIDREATSRGLSKIGVVCTTCLHEQFDGVCSSMCSQLRGHGYL
ncbi:hypothetical protein TNCV_2587951 [Trichonephila clavipes]|nr:hypothetical protein TNCV_2587951 [Trichonephila clavipes]